MQAERKALSKTTTVLSIVVQRGKSNLVFSNLELFSQNPGGLFIVRCKDNVSGDSDTVGRLPHASRCCVPTGTVASRGLWVMLWMPMAWERKNKKLGIGDSM